MLGAGADEAGGPGSRNAGMASVQAAACPEIPLAGPPGWVRIIHRVCYSPCSFFHGSAGMDAGT